MRFKLHIFQSATRNEKLFHLPFVADTIRFRIAMFTIPSWLFWFSKHFSGLAVGLFSSLLCIISDDGKRRNVKSWKLKRNRRRVFNFCLEMVNVSGTGVEHSAREKRLISMFAAKCCCINLTSKRSLKTAALYTLVVVHLRLIKQRVMVFRAH